MIELCDQCSFDVVQEPKIFASSGCFDDRQGSEKYRIVLISKNPWMPYALKANSIKQSFSRKASKLLLEGLDNAKIDPSWCWMTSIVRCSVLSNQVSRVERAFLNCKELLVEEIRLVDPEILVPMGSITYRLLSSLFIGIRTIPILHPEEVIYNQALKTEFLNQMMELKHAIL